MPLADIEASPVRVLMQPILGYARGVKGGKGPTDETGFDILQGFADVKLRLGSDSSLTLRAGRELVALGSERLVGRRYGPNIPQAFDGYRATANLGRLKVELMRLRPVDVRQGDLNDHSSNQRRFDAAYATIGDTSDTALDVYWIRFFDTAAQFGGLTGLEKRDTFGLRYFGSHDQISWNWEVMVQRGTFRGEKIRAWSLASETAVNLPQFKFKPQLRLRANFVSGDSKSNDTIWGSFNAMFPKGKYFGELTPIGPRNIINIQPSAEFDFGSGIGIALSGGAFWRESVGDGIYDIPGREIRGANNNAKHIGNQVELSASWRTNGNLTFAASIARFQTGAFLQQTGLAKPIHMLGFETNVRF